MACEVFKIINKISPEYINDLVEIKTSTYNFRAETGRNPKGKYNQVWAEVLQARGGPCMEKSSKQAAGCRIIPPVLKADP